MTIILGIDPGSKITGYGIIKLGPQKFEFVDCGVIRTKDESAAQKCHYIFSEIQGVLSLHKPDESAVEEVFMNVNVNSALKLGQARGAILAAIASHQVAVHEYSPRRIKQAIVGYGGADKNQIQQMIKVLLNLKQVPTTDAADALAVAICHANSRGIKKYDSHDSW